MKLLGATIGTYRPQYRPLSAIRYLDANPLPTRYPLIFTLATDDYKNPTSNTHNVRHEAIASQEWCFDFFTYIVFITYSLRSKL